MLALEPLELREPLLDLVEAARRRVDPLAVAAQLPGEVVGLDGEGLGAVGERVERRVDPLERGEGRGRVGEGDRGGAAGGPGVAGLAGGIAFEGGHPAGDRPAEALEVPEPLALRGQLGLLRLARGRALDLLELPHQQVELAIARARPGLQLIQRRLGRAGLGVRLGAGRAALRLLRPAEAVEDAQLRGGERELAVLVLAVERQQRAAHVAQVGRRGAAAAEVRARAPLGRHPPREHELVGVRRQAIGQVRGQLRRQREHALDVRLRGARAHDARPRLAAQQQVERVGEDGLARPRLPRQRVQTRPEAQFGALDQQQVLDAELVEHGLDGLPAAGDGSAVL